MDIALVAVTVLFGGFFLIGGFAQLLGQGPQFTPAAACGFSPSACRAIGLLEMFGGVGLLAAHFVPVTGIAAALFLFPVAVAAFVYHSWYRERVLRLMEPAATACVMLCVAVGLCSTRLA